MSGDAMRWLIAAAFPLGLWSCGEAVSPAQETPVEEPPAQVAPVEVQAALSDQEYLVQLGLMRGHLLVGHALYRLDALDAARSHSKHPTDELYADMEREFAARGTTGFSAALEAHALASQGEDATAVDAAYEALTAAITRAEGAVAASPEVIVGIVVELLREAAAEYAVGIVDGRLSNAHEYQDAYGFTKVALSWAQGAGSDEVFDQIVERIEARSDMWPSLVPPEELQQQAARLHRAAAEVEILGSLRSRPAVDNADIQVQKILLTY